MLSIDSSKWEVVEEETSVVEEPVKENQNVSDLAFTKDKNQIATPWHIVEFLSDLLDTKNKVVLDPTAGSGAMLVNCKKSVGIENDIKAFNLLSENNKTGVNVNDSIFSADVKRWIKGQGIEVVLMNPPFNCKKDELSEDYKNRFGKKGQDSTKGLYFVKYVADLVGSGMLAAIVPVGAIGGGNKAIKEIQKELLEKHTLKAVLSFNKYLFYPAVSVSVECLIFELGKAHNEETWFADFSEDGLEMDRTKKCRTDKKNKWKDIKNEWLSLYIKKPTEEGKYILKNIEDNDWSVGRNIVSNIDINPTEEDFRKVVEDYLSFKVNQIIHGRITKDD